MWTIKHARPYVVYLGRKNKTGNKEYLLCIWKSDDLKDISEVHLFSRDTKIGALETWGERMIQVKMYNEYQHVLRYYFKEIIGKANMEIKRIDLTGQ